MHLACPLRLGFAFGLAVAGSGLHPAFAEQSQPQKQQQQQKQPAQQEEDETPTPAPLSIGSMAIASNAALAVNGMAVDVSVDKVTYSYRFKNAGAAKLALAASVQFPDIEVSNEGTTIYLLPDDKPENVVGLEVQANGRPVATTPYVQAVALGIDRQAELKAANIPLIPFGEALEKALTTAKPDVLANLEALGLLIPRDPNDRDAQITADWSLRVVHGWMQTFEPNSETTVVVGFKPIKAVYTIDATNLGAFDALKDQTCLTPKIMETAKSLLTAKGATADVADITLSNDGPARWLDNPAATVAVRKPTPDSIVAFCGMDAGTMNQPVVKGTMPGSGDAAGLRVLIFTRVAAK